MADFVKAIYVKRIEDGQPNKWVRAEVNLVSRAGTTALEGNGHTPGRALKREAADGETYDDVLFFDVWPSQWPRIGQVD